MLNSSLVNFANSGGADFLSVRKRTNDFWFLSYLSKLRRDSVGADFQSVRKLTNYICAKPPESRLSQISKVCYQLRLFFIIPPTLAAESLNHNGLKYY